MSMIPDGPMTPELAQAISETRELLHMRFGSFPKAFVRTYGCQQNVSDSEKLKGLLLEMGCILTEEVDEANIIIMNTCAVREHAEDRVFGNVGALKDLKRRRPSLIIALCGCMMEQEQVVQRIRNSYPYVSLVFGTNSLQRFPSLLKQTITTGKRTIDRGEDDGQVHEGLPISRDGSFKGWLPIMYGCDNFCTYCIVPHVRGRERSRQPAAVLAEARAMVEDGFKDITLLGQNVNSYGKGLTEKTSFPELLRQTSDIEGDFWLRFMTSHPKDASREMIDVMAESPKVCRHLHLPFQSGSDPILRRMNRHYTRDSYLRTVEYAKSRIPDLSLTSDVIVGFPGETEEDFQATLDLIREVEFTSLFTFIYSPRPGTPAASYDDPVTHAEKAERMGRLLKLQEEIAARRSASMVGKEYRVLVEGELSTGVLSTRTAHNIVVEAAGSPELVGSFRQVKVTRAKNWILEGEILGEG